MTTGPRDGTLCMGRSVEGLWVGKMATVSGLPNPLPSIIRVYGCSLAGSVSVVGWLVLRWSFVCAFVSAPCPRLIFVIYF